MPLGFLCITSKACIDIRLQHYLCCCYMLAVFNTGMSYYDGTTDTVSVKRFGPNRYSVLSTYTLLTVGANGRGDGVIRKKTLHNLCK